jgi:hypothetical protein
MKKIEDLPLTMTASDVNRYLRRCRPEVLRDLLKAGKIKGKRINAKRILYNTESVLSCFGLIEPRRPKDE